MIEIKNKENCCGCSACVNICPKQCIRMEDDEQGFSYPVVDQNLCIHCNLCNSVCPIENSTDLSEQKVEAFVGYNNDLDTRMKSSSGGVFSLLAKDVLSQRGVVFGAAFREDLSVCHQMIENEDELYKLQGSKYVQSDCERTYQEAKEQLEKGRKVLYSGTACQIAGLKNYLRKDYSNLLTVDVLCHGVPSKKVWKKYIETASYDLYSPLKSVNFRDKKDGWRGYHVHLQMEDQSHFYVDRKKDDYMRLFLRNICLRPSCYACKFKSLERVSDITLGDCWGVEKSYPMVDDDKGTSVVLIHSEKGKDAYNAIRQHMNDVVAEAEKALPPTADSRKSVAKHPNHDSFFAGLDRANNTHELVKYLKKKKKKKTLLQRILAKIKRYL